MAPLALSLGDPAGIGPEIVVKAWAALRGGGPAFFVVGDAAALAAAPGARRTPLAPIAVPEQAEAAFADALPVLNLPLTAPVVAGHPDPAHAKAVVRWIETGAGLALSGQASGLVTCPIAKKPLYDAGFGFPGHTEFLAELTGQAPCPALAAR